MLKNLDKNQKDIALGSIIGALVGDAAGATLEFLGRTPTDEEVQLALGMTGGGVWDNAAGQITDDGELTLALFRAISEDDCYNPTTVARAYRRWRLSDPFDVGYATDAALSEGDLHRLDLDEIVQRNALLNNADSKANGSLMRATPIGVWSARVDLETTIDAARTDSRMTHPNPSCQWSSAAYVVAIRHLMLNPRDHIGAFDAAANILVSDDAEEVLSWLADARNGDLPPFYPRAGYVRIAFTHAFYHLYHRTTYTEALTAVLHGSGDTDTNACIVGGLVGAIHGLQGIPESMRRAVLTCDVTKGNPRPSWLHPRQIGSD